jgi:YD repeat-containing protein
MRYASFALAAVLLPSTGCAAITDLSGTHVEKFKTKTEVQQEFGSPVSTGAENGQPYEEYHTRRKIAERWSGEGYVMLDTATLGLAELYMFPAALVRLTRNSITGRTVRFTYDEQGNVTDTRSDGSIWRPLDP